MSISIETRCMPVYGISQNAFNHLNNYSPQLKMSRKPKSATDITRTEYHLNTLE